MPLHGTFHDHQCSTLTGCPSSMTAVRCHLGRWFSGPEGPCALHDSNLLLDTASPTTDSNEDIFLETTEAKHHLFIPSSDCPSVLKAFVCLLPSPCQRPSGRRSYILDGLTSLQMALRQGHAGEWWKVRGDVRGDLNVREEFEYPVS